MTSRRVRFCAVGRRSDMVVLASHVFGQDRAFANEALKTVRKILGSAKLKTAPKLTIASDKLGNLHYNTNDDFLYAVVTDADYPRRIGFQFLKELEGELTAKLHADLHSAQGENSVKASFIMDSLCDKYDDVEKVSKTHQLMADVEGVKTVMQDNVNLVLQRGDHLQTAASKAERLEMVSNNLNKNATELARVMRWRDLKLKMVLAVLVLCVVLYIVLPIVQAYA